MSSRRWTQMVFTEAAKAQSKSREEIERLLPGLRTGDAPTIWKLSSCFLKPGSYTPELIVRLTLSNLISRRPPNMEEGGRRGVLTQPHANIAVACLSLLGAILAKVLPEMQSVIVPLLSSLEGVLGWIQLCLDYHVPLDEETFHVQENFTLHPYVSLLLEFTLIDPVALPTLADSKSFLSLLIRIWASPGYRPSRRGALSTPLEQQEAVTIPYLMFNVVNHPLGRKALVEELVLQDLVQQFAASTAIRAKQISYSTKVEKPKFQLETCAGKLMQIVTLVCGTGAHNLLPYFVEAGCIAVLGTMLQDVARFATQKGTVPSLSQPVADLLTLATTKSRCIVRSVSDLLGSGFLLTYTGVTAIAKTKGAGNALKAVSPWTTHPAVLKVLREMWSEKFSLASLNNLLADSEDYETWVQFQATILHRLSTYASFHETYPPICDNVSCDGNTRASRILKSQKQRQCSQCYSVAYCSQECQRVDWYARHRTECLCARKENQDPRDSRSWYKNRTHAFHLTYLTWLYTLPSQVHQREALSAGKAFTEVLPVIDCTGTPDRLLVVDLDTLQDEKSPHPSSFRERRLQELWREYASGSLPSNMRLVKGIFANGPEHDIHLMVMLKISDCAGREPYVEAVYSVPCLRDVGSLASAPDKLIVAPQVSR